MPGNAQRRIRDHFREFWGLPKSTKPITPQSAGVPLSSTVPSSNASTTSTTTAESRRFLELALQQLTPGERDTVLSHQATGTRDITNAVHDAYSAACSKKQDCEGKRWSWTFCGKNVVLRDEAEKVIRMFDRFKSVGDVIANVDPLHVGLPWAGIRIILQMSIAESRQMAALLTGMRLTLSMVHRLEVYFAYYQCLRTMLATDNLANALITTYAHVLRFIAIAIQTYEQNALSRTRRALWETFAIEDFEKECDKLGARAEIEASNCDRAVSAQDRDNAKQLKADLELALQRLDGIAKIHTAVDSLHVKFDLSKLRTASGASYDSHADEHLAQCLPGTRTDLLDQIAIWADDPRSKSVFWLCGKAGTGKSTISRTVAGILDKQRRLGASFFFKRGEADRSNASRFFPTIALQFTSVVPGIGQDIAEALDADSILCERKLQDQFERLLSQPLLRAGQQLQSRALFIVIDALDECGRKDDIRMLLRLLFQLPQAGGATVRILVTSRPETPIQTGFRSIDGALHEDVMLEDVQATSIEHDIRVYLGHRFKEIRDECALQQTGEGLPADWPGVDDTEALVKLATPLFIFAFTVCLYVSQRDPKGRLQGLLRPQKGISLSGMNEMYLTILDRTLMDSDYFERNQAVEDFRTVVGSIAVLADPLSAHSLAKLLRVPRSVIDDTLRPLHSVLQIPVSPTSSIRLLHLSFRDFLLDSRLEHSNKFHIHEVETHTRLAEQCLQRLSQQDVLSNDLCKVSRPGAPRAEFSTDYVAEHLQPDVAYACSFWALHAIRSKQALRDDDLVHNFLQKHFLHWLEALSWLGRISDAIGFVSKLRSAATGSNVSMFLQDAHRFLLRNRHIIDLAPLQTYHSALVFAPVNSIVRKAFTDSYLSSFVLLSAPLDWGAKLQRLEGGVETLHAVAFSPDGTLIASAGKMAVRLWDASTGAEMQTLDHIGYAYHPLAFSPDGTLIASANWTSVRLWDASTGEEIQTLRGHNDVIMRLAFSPDGMLIASASDSTVRLWNTSTGVEMQTEMRTFGWHENQIKALAFSPDGTPIAFFASKKESTMQLWNVLTGEEMQILKGDRCKEITVAFSHDDMLVAFTTFKERTIFRRWNVSKGEETQTFDKHENDVSALAFSPDGTLLASASWDRVVRIWNVFTGEETHTLKGHDQIDNVAFSPNGTLLALVSSANPAVLLLDASTSDTQTYTGYNGPTDGLAFSPDGTFVASWSFDYFTVRFWDVSTGEETQNVDWPGFAITAVALSPHGTRLASASMDGEMQLWEVSTGEEVQTCNTHEDQVCAIAFSPDGALVASAGRTIQLWNTSTGDKIQTFGEPDRYFTALAFSPDGTHILSASDDPTLRLWNSSTGKQVRRLETSRVVYQITFSGNGQFLHTDSGVFHIDVQQASENLVLVSPSSYNMRGPWVQKSEQDILWLPYEYRGGYLAVLEGTLVVGSLSGNVSFFKCK